MFELRGVFTDPSTGPGTLTHVYVADADNREVLEYDGITGQILRWYAYGNGPDAMLNEMNVAANARATPIPDIQGSVIGSLDAASGALFKAGYLPFGENTSTTTGRFRFTGRRLDTNTASGAQPSGLYYYRARVYAPDLGRFLQPDPIGYAGGLNVYGYVGNDPLNLVDPLGLAAQVGGGGSGVLPSRNTITGLGNIALGGVSVGLGGISIIGGVITSETGAGAVVLGGGGIVLVGAGIQSIQSGLILMAAPPVGQNNATPQNTSGGSTGSGPQPPQPPYNFYTHAFQKLKDRDYNLQDIQSTLQNVARTIQQSNGNTVFVGRNGIGVVVDQSTNEIVTVLRPGMVPR